MSLLSWILDFTSSMLLLILTRLGNSPLANYWYYHSRLIQLCQLMKLSSFLPTSPLL